jgi:hypothetical protein
VALSSVVVTRTRLLFRSTSTAALASSACTDFVDVINAMRATHAFDLQFNHDEISSNANAADSMPHIGPM